MGAMHDVFHAGFVIFIWRIEPPMPVGGGGQADKLQTWNTTHLRRNTMFCRQDH